MMSGTKENSAKPSHAGGPVGTVLWLQDLLTDVMFLLSGLVLFTMTSIFCIEVVLRYFANLPTTWANDTFSNLLCVMVFLAVPHATRSSSHISVTVISDTMPRVGGLLTKFALLVSAGVVAWFTWMSFNGNLVQFSRGVLTEQYHPIPRWWISGFITFGFANAAVYLARSALNIGASSPMISVLDSEPEGSGHV